MLYVYLRQSIGPYLSGPAGNSREHCIVKSLLPVCRCYSLSPPPLPPSSITPPAVLIIWSCVPLAGNTTSVPFPHDTASCAILTAVRQRRPICHLFQGKGRTRETRSLDTILCNKLFFGCISRSKLFPFRPSIKRFIPCNDKSAKTVKVRNHRMRCIHKHVH